MNIDRLLFNSVSSVCNSLNDLRNILRLRMFTREFDHRADDIYVVTYMKSGTTLLQMMLYQLLTDGDMNFDHIYDVSPWIEHAIARYDLLKGFPSPRIMKTHSRHKYLPRKMKGKIIYCVRNGMDVAVSMYNHGRDLGLLEMPWDEFLHKKFAGNSWFTHVSEWLENKKKLNIFYVRYEDLTQNMRKCIEELSLFLEINPREEVIQRTLERCSFSYMKANQEKFGERPIEDKRRYDQFIRKGESFKGHLNFNEVQTNWYHSLYNKHLGKFPLGYGAAGITAASTFNQPSSINRL